MDVFGRLPAIEIAALQFFERIVKKSDKIAKAGYFVEHIVKIDNSAKGSCLSKLLTIFLHSVKL